MVGLVLTGSRGRGPFAREGSDWDVRLVVNDASACETYWSEHGDLIEAVVLTLEQFEQAAEIGAPNEWDRYSYTHATVVIDKLDGVIARRVAEKGVLPLEAAREIAERKLGAYLNSYYRSIRNGALGLTDAARLDAAESVSPFLTALFAMHARVRPYNKFLRWELEEHPLDGWQADELLARLALIGTGDLDAQRQLFRAVEPLVRDCGHGHTIDSWEPHVVLLRGN